MSDAGDATPASLADRLEHLFSVVRRSDGKQFTNDEVAAAIVRDQGVSISASYIWYLRTGQRDNPTVKHLAALARFFGVPAAYFFDDLTAEQVRAELALAAALRDAQVRSVALRAAGLSSASLETISDMLERVRQLEGLPPAQSAGDAAGRQNGDVGGTGADQGRATTT